MFQEWYDLLFPPKAPPPVYTVREFDGGRWEVLQNGIYFPSAWHDNEADAQFVAANLNRRQQKGKSRRRRYGWY